MVNVRQGEVWWTSALDKRRPVLVVTRNQVLDRLGTIVVAPVTRWVRRSAVAILRVHAACAIWESSGVMSHNVRRIA